ncbi:MAG: SGNH/GDSL hydrolase family protein [Nitrospinae bacterium]|nr:SGNH/GDSL hydrolase family protein [Nitrospinota bacterium]
MRRILFPLGLALLVALPFALVEGGVRLFMAPVDALELFVTPFEQRHNKRTDAIFIGDPLVGWRLKPGVRQVWWDFTLVLTNKAGLRAEQELGPKGEGVYRIVSLGDSVTFGYRSPVVMRGPLRNPDIAQGDYPTLTARLLQDGGIDAEAFPLAVPGYSSRQGRLWYEEVAGDLDADLVTILFGWNDADLRPAPDRVTFDGDRFMTGARGMVAASQTLSHLSQWWRKRSDPPTAPPYASWVPRSTTQEYVENVMAMARLARSTGAAVVVIAPVYRDPATDPALAARMGAFRNALGERCAAEGIVYLVIPELTEGGHPANASYFDAEPIHPTIAGHRLLARRLAAFIRGTEEGK